MLLLPQRYKFSSKSQLPFIPPLGGFRCCCYRKGTNFQANHNRLLKVWIPRIVVVATAKVQIFKQITTSIGIYQSTMCCCCYRKGTNFQANHNTNAQTQTENAVVVATAKVQIFKQITTLFPAVIIPLLLLLLPQRYKFSSKSQRADTCPAALAGCCCYRKGTNFQANHNGLDIHLTLRSLLLLPQRYKFSSKSQLPQVGHFFRIVVVATAKVQIFKQITTHILYRLRVNALLLLPQRYKFSSKSQRTTRYGKTSISCCCYRKGTNFQANHNSGANICLFVWLLLLPQRYKFSSKSQLARQSPFTALSCCCYRKGTNFQANHNQHRL